ncbi:Pleckstrin homology domain-containing protein [Strongyloides ratti]|uniref:Pleckstrin homology domain-containing protein n=1 Tax=Strongyloides ratti TaxID=34506 RepID=A0A090LHD0_STRRB|nr:Pleckstrin homology domain-containing protein [Strongyloides ratti]CEF67543.1 Pleckstrin homology domain-containing protein [Strongyloides ratti]
MHRQPSILDSMRLRSSEKNKKVPLRLCSEWRFDSSTLIYGTLTVAVSKNILTRSRSNFKERFIVINNNNQLLIYTNMEEGYVVNIKYIKQIKEKFHKDLDLSQRVSKWYTEFIIISSNPISPEYVSIKINESENIDEWRKILKKTSNNDVYLNVNIANMSLPPMCTNKTKSSKKSLSRLHLYQTYAFDRKNSTSSLRNSVTEIFRKSLIFQKKSCSSSDNLFTSSFYNMSATKSLNFSDDVFEETYNRPLIETGEKESEKFAISYDKVSKDSGVSINNSTENLTGENQSKNEMYDGIFHYELLSPNVAKKLASLKSNNLPLFTVEMGLSMLNIKTNKN